MWARCSGSSATGRRVAYFLISTVVTVNLTPFSHRTMKSLWQNGQFPTFSPSCPAWRKQTHKETDKKRQSESCDPIQSLICTVFIQRGFYDTISTQSHINWMFPDFKRMACTALTMITLFPRLSPVSLIKYTVRLGLLPFKGGNN